MLSSRFAALDQYPFRQLADLLGADSPRTNAPLVDMSIGEPRRQPPAFVHEIIAAHSDGWNRYPPVNGTPEFRAACAGWLSRRFDLPVGMIDSETQIVPVSGSREGLFSAAFLAISPTEPGAPPPLALMPNPFYQVYCGAAICAGAEARFLPASQETGYLPDLHTLDASTLARTQLMYLCTPGNPQGAVADLDYLKHALSLARANDFLLVLDECYCEIYSGEEPPPGGLQAALALGGGCDNLLALHTLSKRSSVPGLRSGFAVGSPAAANLFGRLRSYNAAASPVATLAAATALWNDDAHVVETRAHYRTLIDSAERILSGRFGFFRPKGGFYLWLQVGDGERAAKTLWRDAGVKVLPGKYLTQPDADGSNSGTPYIRVALVHDVATTEAGLNRIAQTL